MFVVIGTICYATSSNTVASYLQDTSSMVISTVSFMMLLPLAIVFFIGSDVVSTLASHPQAWSSLGYIFILAITSTVFATVLYYKLVHLTGAIFSSG